MTRHDQLLFFAWWCRK